MDSPLVARMREHATSVFAEMSHLARRTESINLGQGFPDTDGPALEDAYRSGLYTRLDGLNLDPMHDVLIFSGMVVLAVDGCIRLCNQLQLEQQAAANTPLQPRSIDQIAA